MKKNNNQRVQKYRASKKVKENKIKLTKEVKQKSKILNEEVQQKKKIQKNLRNLRYRNKLKKIQKSLENVSDLEPEIEVPDLCSTVDIENSVAKAIGYIRRTCSQWGGKNPCITSCDNMTFSACVCVVCDTFIIGTEEICWLSKDDLIKFKPFLGSKALEEYIGKSLPREIKEQYSVKNCLLEGLLLSPRARMIDDEYMCCASCHRSLHLNRVNVPPRFAIANGWLIGSIPDSISSGTIDEITSALLAPIRPFAYIISYTGGGEKKLQGHYTFFKNNVSHLSSIVNCFNKTNANPHIYCVLCGRFTPDQRKLAKLKSSVDIRLFSKLINFFKDVNNYVYENIPIPNECPQPVVIAEEANNNNTDNSVDKTVETIFEGGRFFFPDVAEPSTSTGTFESQAKFADAVLKGTSPTLLCKGLDYVDVRNNPLPEIFPVQFPFGLGDVHDDRRNKVSVEAGLKHYLKLSLP